METNSLLLASREKLDDLETQVQRLSKEKDELLELKEVQAKKTAEEKMKLFEKINI